MTLTSYPTRFTQVWQTGPGLQPIPVVATDVVLVTTYLDKLYVSNPTQVDSIQVWVIDKLGNIVVPGIPCDPGQLIPIPLLGVPAQGGFYWYASEVGALGWIQGKQP